MKPACVNCNIEMEQTITGVKVGLVITDTSATKAPPPPPTLYQVWHGDQFNCPQCKARIVARYAQRPIWERHHTEPAPTVDVMVLAK